MASNSTIKENPSIPDNKLAGRILMASLFLPYSYSSEDFTIYRNLSLAGNINSAKGSVKAALSASASLKKVLSNTSLKQTKEKLKLKAKASQRILRQKQQLEQQQRKERLQVRLLKQGSSSSLRSSNSDMLPSPLSSPRTSLPSSSENLSKSLSSKFTSTDSLNNSQDIPKPDLENIINIKSSMLGNVGLQNAIASVSLPVHYPRKPE
eukprot:jgi/Orpsp1_1/1187626/evm.model.d7180000059100.1